MARFGQLLLSLLLVVGFTTQGEAGDTASVLASHKLSAPDGAEHLLSEHRGEVVVVNFWASWCAPCLEELPVLDDWHAEWSARGARVVAISVDSSPKKAERFVKKAELGLDVYIDGPNGVARELDLPSLPCTYVLDRSGKLVLTTMSSSEEDLALVRRTVERLLDASAPVETAAANGGAR